MTSTCRLLILAGPPLNWTLEIVTPPPNNTFCMYCSTVIELLFTVTDQTKYWKGQHDNFEKTHFQLYNLEG